MTPKMKRRALLGAGVGSVAAVGAGLGVRQAFADPAVEAASSPEDAAKAIKESFDAESKAAGGWWNGYISVAGTDGELIKAVDQDSDKELEAWSCNKVAVAIAVLDKVDRGDIKIDQLVEVTKEIVSDDGDGIFGWDDAYPSSVTMGHVLANMLTVSDNTAVRLCGTLVPGPEINEIMKDKGFPKTQVQPLPDNPNRFYLGLTTPKESHDILQGLLKGDLLSKESTERILTLTRAPVAFTDGVRRNMSSDERLRIATKAGWLKDQRNEIGVIYDASGAPVVTYSMFGGGQGQPDNFGATHPATEAYAKMGRSYVDVIDKIEGVKKLETEIPHYDPVNGG
ncbi:MAG: serine hydrolase [Stackebrandtia sp.]